MSATPPTTTVELDEQDLLRTINVLSIQIEVMHTLADADGEHPFEGPIGVEKRRLRDLREVFAEARGRLQ